MGWDAPEEVGSFLLDASILCNGAWPMTIAHSPNNDALPPSGHFANTIHHSGWGSLRTRGRKGSLWSCTALHPVRLLRLPCCWDTRICRWTRGRGLASLSCRHHPPPLFPSHFSLPLPGFQIFTPPDSPPLSHSPPISPRGMLSAIHGSFMHLVTCTPKNKHDSIPLAPPILPTQPS